MNDAQILSIAVVVVAVLAGSFFNNKRIDDMRDLLRAEMSKNHGEMLHRFADLDSRLNRIEERFLR